MGEFFSFLRCLMFCGTVFFLAMLVLLALPKSRLRSVGVEISRWVVAGFLLLMVPSPVDLIPDVIPGIGWLDDIGYLAGSVCAVRSALNLRRRRLELEEDEASQLPSRRSGGEV
ncbi:MAG: YkvA family protein [Phycisphaerales bacterium]